MGRYATPTTHVTDYCLPQSAISAQRRSRDIPLLQHLLSSSVHHDGPQAEVTQETNYYSQTKHRRKRGTKKAAIYGPSGGHYYTTSSNTDSLGDSPVVIAAVIDYDSPSAAAVIILILYMNDWSDSKRGLE
jgi:hypothetical protein